MRLKALRNHTEIEQVSPVVMTVRFENVKAGWEQWIMLTSDRHHDNIHSDHALERKHLELAMERDALVFDIGDLFCAMQGRGDPRGNYDDLRPENKEGKYLDTLVSTAYQFYRPYADHWAMLGMGNHESAVVKHRNTNLTDRLAAEMRKESGCEVVNAGYKGWVRFQFCIHRTVQLSRRMYFNHGSGRGAMMSFGTLDVRRQASYLPEADIVVNGHTHDGYVVPLARERLSEANTESRDICWFLRTMTYKDEWTNKREGFSVEKSGGPKPLGCIWGRFYFTGKSDIGVEFTQGAS